ncbi:MAG: hypothetical protein H6550_16015 [Chitinophagales bacterium]|nr:hypothetical protein [Chitinophagales bacterium]
MNTYTIVESDDIGAFTDEVNALIAKGYVPHGFAVSQRIEQVVSPYSSDRVDVVKTVYHQAMVPAAVHVTSVWGGVDVALPGKDYTVYTQSPEHGDTADVVIPSR